MPSHTPTFVFKELSLEVYSLRNLFLLLAKLDPLHSADHGGAGSEDCLKVNVYTPAGVKSDAQRKRIVWAKQTRV